MICHCFVSISNQKGVPFLKHLVEYQIVKFVSCMGKLRSVSVQFQFHMI